MTPKTPLHEKLELPGNKGVSEDRQELTVYSRRNIAMNSIIRMNREKKDKDLSQNTLTAIVERKSSDLTTIEHCLIIVLVKLIYHCKNGDAIFLECMIACIRIIQNHFFYLLVSYTYSGHECNDRSSSFLFCNVSLISLKYSKIESAFKRLCILDEENIENNLFPSPADRRLLELEPKPKICSKWHVLTHYFLKHSLLIHCHSTAQRYICASKQIKRKYCMKRFYTLQTRLRNDITVSFDNNRLMSVIVNPEYSRLSLRCLSPNITDLLYFEDNCRFIDDTKVTLYIPCLPYCTKDKDDNILARCLNRFSFKTSTVNRTVSEENTQEHLEIVSDSEVDAPKRSKRLCTKLQNNQESLEPLFQNVNDQNRECTKCISLKPNTVNLKLVRERTRTNFQSEKLENYDLPFIREVNDDVIKEKSVLHPYTRFLCFEHTEPLVAIVNPVFGKEKDSKDTKDRSDSSCSEQKRSLDQEQELRRETSDNHETNNNTEAAAALPLDAYYDHNDVGIDGHGKVSDGLSKQALEDIPNVTDANDVETTSESSARECSLHDTARDIAIPPPDVDNGTLQGFEPLMSIIDKIAEGQRVPPQVTMRYEMLRFCTLRSYPTENKPYTIRLAQAGFYYARNGDELVCYCCASRKSNWTENDKPLDIHRELNPNCSFLVRNSEVNVPIRSDGHLSDIQQSFPNQHDGGNSSSTREAVPQSENNDRTSEASRGLPQGTPNVTPTDHLAISSGYRAKQRTSHGNFVQVDTPRPARQEVQQQSSGFPTINEFSYGNPAGSSQSGTGAVNQVLPKYPKYASITVRLTSFNDCGDIVVRPESLAEAGFFYAGFGDCVRCFQCGVGLRHWSEEDDPWIEHSRWSKDCSFVRQARGQEFVRLVQMAVQYSQAQNGNQPSQNEFAASSNLGTNGDEIDRLLHTNAAQSVLEMGYEPDVIRRAIRLILDENGKAVLSASNLMEKIFVIEESTPSDSDQTTSASQSSSGARSGAGDGGNLREEGSSANSSNPRSTSASGGASFTGSASGPISASLSEGGSSKHENSSNIKRSLGLEQKRLKEENEKLKMQSICTKCKKRDVSIVFLPCGHLVTCEECAPTVKYCTVPSCGKYIKGTVRTYVS